MLRDKTTKRKWVAEAASVKAEKGKALQVWECGDCGAKLVSRNSLLDSGYLYCPFCGEPKKGEIAINGKKTS